MLLILQADQDEKYGKKPTEDAQWCNNSLNWSRLVQHIIYGSKMENLIIHTTDERENTIFDDNFPGRKGRVCKREHINDRLKMFFPYCRLC